VQYRKIVLPDDVRAAVRGESCCQVPNRAPPSSTAKHHRKEKELIMTAILQAPALVVTIIPASVRSPARTAST
jgi:hypothetical protein